MCTFWNKAVDLQYLKLRHAMRVVRYTTSGLRSSGESGEKVISRFPAKSANADDVDCDTHTLDA